MRSQRCSSRCGLQALFQLAKGGETVTEEDVSVDRIRRDSEEPLTEANRVFKAPFL